MERYVSEQLALFPGVLRRENAREWVWNGGERKEGTLSLLFLLTSVLAFHQGLSTGVHSSQKVSSEYVFRY